jgi:hypothetical protein
LGKESSFYSQVFCVRGLFKIKCSDTIFFVETNYGVAWMYETGENDFDQPLHHVFESNGQIGMLTGMSSYHNDGNEDRKFKY